MSRLDQYAQLAAMLHDMEKDLGLEDLTKAEKSVLSAIKTIQPLSDNETFVSSARIQKHSLCSDMPAPTFFRALAVLLERKIITLPEGRSKGLYRLTGMLDTK